MATVGIKALRAVLQAALLAKRSPEALLAPYGVTRENLADPEFRFAHLAWSQLWDEVARQGGDPGGGLHTAESLAEGHWDLIDYAIASSPTLGDAFRRFSRFFPLISTAVRHVFTVGREDARLVREYVEGAPTSSIGTEFAFANIALRFRRLCSVPWVPSVVTFRHRPGADGVRSAQWPGHHAQAGALRAQRVSGPRGHHAAWPDARVHGRVLRRPVLGWPRGGMGEVGAHRRAARRVVPRAGRAHLPRRLAEQRGRNPARRARPGLPHPGRLGADPARRRGALRADAGSNTRRSLGSPLDFSAGWPDDRQGDTYDGREDQYMGMPKTSW